MIWLLHSLFTRGMKNKEREKVKETKKEKEETKGIRDKN